MILLRHGQSYFNLHFTATKQDPGIADPELTPLGQVQADAAAQALRGVEITRIIVSPYTRALQTVAPLLRARPDVPVEVWPEVRERAVFSCDVGSHPEILAERFPHHEFGHLPPVWWHEGTETEDAVIGRAGWFRERMTEDSAAETTLLVSHWAFILALSGVSAMNGEVLTYDLGQLAPQSLVWRP